MAIKDLHQVAAVAAGIGQERLEGEIDRTDDEIERAGLYRLDVAIVFLARNRLPFDDVAGPEEGHEIPQIGQLLRRIVDRRRSYAEQLIAAGAAHRIDGGEAAAVADRELRRVGARAQIFRHFDLLVALDHLKQKRQAGDETDHGDEP